ncbi:hypothetical protein D1007_30929 [Hordeum vulgare]|nr:hypothetical protein D1007_30929 [Hordeum vulgare]
MTSPSSGSGAPSSAASPSSLSSNTAQPPGTTPVVSAATSPITSFVEIIFPHGARSLWRLLLDRTPPPPNADTQYRELDAHVALWIYATLADPIIDHVVGATTTYIVWTKIKDYFLANRAARFMLLNRQYRNLKQGDLSVTEYARRLKLLTDGLADIDYAVTEVDLMTQFLHGLDKRLDTIRVVLGDQGLPFNTVLSRVVLTEESMTHRAAKESASAFALPGAGSSTNVSSSGGRPQGDRAADRTSDRPPANHPHPPQQQRVVATVVTVAVDAVVVVVVVVTTLAVVASNPTLRPPRSRATSPPTAWRSLLHVLAGSLLMPPASLGHAPAPTPTPTPCSRRRRLRHHPTSLRSRHHGIISPC